MTIRKLQDYELAEQIITLSTLAISMNIDRLKEFQEDYKNEISQYEAIGIIDGHEYFNKLNKMQARYKRLVALISFITVSIETEADATK
jgi:hypothetical protein